MYFRKREETWTGLSAGWLGAYRADLLNESIARFPPRSSVSEKRQELHCGQCQQLLLTTSGGIRAHIDGTHWEDSTLEYRYASYGDLQVWLVFPLGMYGSTFL